MTEATIEQDRPLLPESCGNKEKLQVKRLRCNTWCARESSARNLIIENPLHDIPLALPERPRFLSWGVNNDYDTEDDHNWQLENYHESCDELDHPQDTFLEEKENRFPFYSLSICYWNEHTRKHEDLSIEVDGDLSQTHSVCDEVSDPSYLEHVEAPPIDEAVPFAFQEANNYQHLRGTSLTPEGITRNGIHAPSVLGHPSILGTKKISKSRDRHCTTYLFSVLVGTVVTVVFAIYVVVAIFS